MASQIHVLNRSGAYYFRRRVPKDLLSLYPSSQIIFSLKTKDAKKRIGSHASNPYGSTKSLSRSGANWMPELPLMR